MQISFTFILEPCPGMQKCQTMYRRSTCIRNTKDSETIVENIAVYLRITGR